MVELIFDPIKHEYFFGEKKLPSVTDIVGDICGTPQYATELDMQKGSMVHKALAMYLRGNLHSVEARIQGKVEAGKKAIKELSLVDFTFLEKKIYHPLYQFAGTPDVIVGDRLIDWKSGHYPSVEPQFGGYVLLLETQKHKIKNCLEIVLSDDGTYKVTEYKPARCKGLFLACMTIFQWRKNGK